MKDDKLRDQLAKEYSEKKWVLEQRAVNKDGFKAGYDAGYNSKQQEQKINQQAHLNCIEKLNQANERIVEFEDIKKEHVKYIKNLKAIQKELIEALKETLSCIDQHTDDPVIGPIIEYSRSIISKGEK